MLYICYGRFLLSPTPPWDLNFDDRFICMSGFQVAFLVLLCRLKHGSHSVYVTASTGFAACNIGGTTLHSFAGIGLGDGDKETLLDKVANKRESKIRWQNAKALLIDEISMIDSNMFVSVVSPIMA